MALLELLVKGSDSDLLREMIGNVTQRLTKLDVEGPVGAIHGGGGDGRENWRDVYRERHWHTSSGTIALRIPNLQRGSGFAAFLEPRQLRRLVQDKNSSNQPTPQAPVERNATTHKNADRQFATWNRSHGIPARPAAIGTLARRGPENRPTMIAPNPHFRENS
jgi:hypothetical protein